LQVIGKNALEFKFIEEIQKEKEELSLILFQSIPNKLEKIEYIVQK
jgi:16S rRNA U1498 N3-methylase RsmE